MKYRLTPQMRTVLEALAEHEGVIFPGTTMGEVEASGGSRGVLYNAIRKGWANYYTTEKYPGTESTTRRYYRTDEGTAVLKEDDDMGPECLRNKLIL